MNKIGIVGTSRAVCHEREGAAAPTLLPLPGVPFELAAWVRPKVGPDAHALVGRTLCSVPWRLIGQRLGARSAPQDQVTG